MYFAVLLCTYMAGGRECERPYVRFFGYNDGSAADVACARAKKKTLRGRPAPGSRPRTADRRAATK